MSLYNVHFDNEGRFDMLVSRRAADELVPYAMLPEDQADTSMGSFIITSVSPRDLEEANERVWFQETPRTLPQVLHVMA